MTSEIKNRTALVIGGSGGIGRAAAIALAGAGYDVAVHCNSNLQAAKETAQQINNMGRRAIAVPCDLTDTQAVERMCEDVCICLGRISVLVNSAGIADVAPFSEIDAERWRRMMSVDLDGVFNCCRALLPRLEPGDSIVNVSSVWGIYGASCEVPYSAAKAGVIGFTAALAKELGPSGVRVNCVAPGVIETPMNGWLSEEERRELEAATPLGRFGTPEEVADAIVFLASSAASFITGVTLPVTGGFTG